MDDRALAGHRTGHCGQHSGSSSLGRLSGQADDVASNLKEKICVQFLSAKVESFLKLEKLIDNRIYEPNTS